MPPKAKRQKILTSTTTTTVSVTSTSGPAASMPVSAIAARRLQLLEAASKASTPEIEEHLQVDNVDTDEEDKVSLKSDPSGDSADDDDDAPDQQEEDGDVTTKAPIKRSKVVLQNERRDRKLFVDPRSVSSFKPTRYNLACASTAGMPDLILVGMKRGQTIVFQGCANIVPIVGYSAVLGHIMSGTTEKIRTSSKKSSGRATPRTIDLSSSSSFTVISPRTHALAVIESISLDGMQKDLLVPQLYEPTSPELRAQLELLVSQIIVDNFDTVIAIQAATDCGIFGIEKVVPLFKGILSVKQNSRLRGTEDEEKQLQTRFETSVGGFYPIQEPTDSIAALTMPSTWQEAMQALIQATVDEGGRRVKEPPVSIVCGGKKMGKSTFSRLIMNRMLNRYRKVAFIECDIGQSEFTPVGMVTLHVIEIPALGAPFTHPRQPYRAFFLGNSTPRDDPDYYMACIKELVKTYYEEVSHTRRWANMDEDGYHSDDDDDEHIPLIINTQGWIKGMGYDLLLQLLDYTAASHIFAFHSPSIGDSNLPQSFSATLKAQTITHGRRHPAVHYLAAVSLGDDNNLSPFTKYHPADHRALALLSYFYLKSERGRGLDSTSGHQLKWDFSQALVVRRPWCWDWSKAKGVWILFDQVPPSQILHVLNASLVALTGDKERSPYHPSDDAFSSENDDPAGMTTAPSQEPTLTEQNKAPNYFPLGIFPPPPPEHTTCYGLAIIRSIQPATRTFHFLTPIPPSKLQKCNGVVKGAIHMPLHANLDHNEESNTIPGVAGVPWKKVPYLHYEAPTGNYPGSLSPSMTQSQLSGQGYMPPTKIIGADAKVTRKNLGRHIGHMADLNAFRTGLVLSQDTERDHRSAGGPDGDRPIPHMSKTTTGEQGTLQTSLGHAFLVLFQSNRSAIRKAMVDISAENALSSSLRTIIYHIEVLMKDGSEETSWLLRIQEVYDSLLDKLLKKSEDATKQIALLLLDWLVLQSSRNRIVARAFGADLVATDDKRRKMALLLAMEHALKTHRHYHQQHQKLVGRQDDDSSKQATEARKKFSSSEALEGSTLLTWIKAMPDIIHDHTAVAADGTRSMTRLTSIAWDMSIRITRILADRILNPQAEEKTSQESVLVKQIDVEPTLTSGEQYFLESMDSIAKILRDYQLVSMSSSISWIQGFRIASEIDQFLGPGSADGSPTRDTLRSFAQSWNVISSALAQRGSVLAPEDLLDYIDKYLQVSVQPFSKPMTICLLLGQCVSKSSAEDVLRMSSRQLKANLLTVSAVVIAEDMLPVGKNSALVLYEAIASIMNKTEFVESWETTMDSMLDLPSEISVDAAALVARTIMAFPANFVSRLIAHFQSREGQKKLTSDNNAAVNNGASLGIRNALRVVSTLTDLGFFQNAQSVENENLKHTLEEAVMSLLYVDDRQINKMACKLGAAIDPSRLIKLFAPELTSIDKEVRSRAGSAILECTLLQAADGSLGDGFVALLNHICGSSSTNLYRNVTTPAQLHAKAKELQIMPVNSAPDEKVLSGLFHFVMSMSTMIPNALWNNIIDRLVLRTYASPGSHLLIRVWNHLAPSIANNNVAISALLKAILNILEQQGILTEDTLEAALDVCDEALDDLRLARLSPLLILKTIPSEAIAQEGNHVNESDSDDEIRSLRRRTFEALKARTDNPLEFQLARELAKDVSQGMFPDFSDRVYMIHLQATL
ncbi:Polynucleotide 5'-hydroxyl-kinase grc3 [Mortierella claussenii]|nr:Polynucleotide 5'-hydroxyl-kinase grc3 [Mortierella claussenii]